MATVKPRAVTRETAMKQAPAYHGIRNAKYAVRTDGGSATVKDFAYAKSISFDPAIEQQAQHMNDEKVLTLVSDQGYTGTFGTSAQNREFEKDIGQVMDVEGALADVNLIGFTRFDVYFEYTEYTQSGVPYTVKVWTLNVEASKASKANNTDTNAATLGEYSYPLTVYGDKIKAADGTTIYADENGNERVATRVISVPGDAGYEDFGKTVPVVKMPTPAA